MRDDGRELGELKRVVISLLQNIDALGSDHVLIAATNHDHLLDPAIWRRFQYKVKLVEPNKNARANLLQRFLGTFATPELIESIAAISDGMTGAQLKQVAEDCVREAVLSDRPSIPLATAVTRTLAANPKTAAVSALGIGEQMKELRKLDKKAFTQAKLSSIFGIPQTTVSYHLRSKT
jgi:SpoVK/Ycf46/Vps4 family AAA+-type ATPase